MIGLGQDAAATQEPMDDDASKLEAVKGMLLQLVQLLGGDDGENIADSPVDSGTLEMGANTEEGGDEGAPEVPLGGDAAQQDPKAKMLAMLKAKMQGGGRPM